MLPHTYIDSVATYWTLRLLMMAIFICCGWGITYRNTDNKYFWYYAWVIIVAYSLSEGLRFGRGRDYMLYANEMMTLVVEDREPLYRLFVEAVRWLRVPYWLVFILYSYLLIYGLMRLVRHFPHYAVWILPAFFLLTDYPAECLIRQFIAMAFYFLGFAAYYDGHRLKMWLYMLCVPLIHVSGLVGLAAFFLMVYFKPDAKLTSVWWILGPYIAVVMLFDVNSLGALADLLKQINIGGRFQHYLSHADRWFTSQGSIAALFGKQLDMRFIYFRLLFNGVMIYMGWEALKSNPLLRIPFWFATIGAFFTAFGGEIELYVRFGWWFNIMMPIMFGAVMSQTEEINLFKRLATLGALALAYGLQYVYSIGKPAFDGCAFVWDVVG